MKRVRFFLSFIFLFVCGLSSIVSAIPACGQQDDNQLIFRLSDVTNAHGSAYDQTGYSTEICYNTLFGSLYSGPNPHVCTAGNMVVRLNSNAEAPTETTPGYSPICYGDLSCVARTGVCQPGEVKLFGLSAQTNAHLEISNFSSYTTLICCTAGASNRLVLGEWQTMGGQKIGQSVGLGTYVNRTVQMVIYTTFAVGTTVNNALWEDDVFVDDFLGNYTGQTDTTGTVRIPLFISDALIALGATTPEGGFEEFQFIATQDAQSLTSEILDVNMTAGPNTHPIANITAPVHRGVYYDGTTVEFKQQSIDPEGSALRFIWSINEDSFTTTNETFNYTFSSPGLKTVTLRVVDDHGASDEDQVAILVVASPGMLAFVNYPRHLQPIFDENRRVVLNASDSYVINSQGSCPDVHVTCLAGNCPLRTQNAPLGCAPNLTVEQTPQGWNSIYFDWAFNDGDQGTAYADGLGHTHVTKEFAQSSGSATDYKHALLGLNYTNTSLGIFSLMANTDRFFSILPRCVNSGERWVTQYDARSGDILSSQSTRTTDYCKGTDGYYNSADDCCPLDATSCTVNGCRANNVSMCQDLQTRASCTSAPHVIYENPNNPGFNEDPACGSQVNGSIVRCNCGWFNDTTNTGRYCALNKTTLPGSWNGGTPVPCSPSMCVYLPVSPPAECVNGYATVVVQVNYTQGTCVGGITQAQCESGAGQKTILCGRPTISLAFFGTWQFISALGIVLVVYLFIDSNRKR